MAPSIHPPVVRLSSDDPAGVETDLLVVPAFDGEAVGDALPAIDQATQGEVKRATASGEIRGRLYETFVTPASGGGWKAGRIAIIGAGKAADFTSERLRKVATAAALTARGRRIPRVAFLLRGPIPARAAVQAVTEGLILAGFSVDQYKTGERFGPAATALTVVAPKREFPETPALEERGPARPDSRRLEQPGARASRTSRPTC